jgi:hypothetical protein
MFTSPRHFVAAESFTYNNQALIFGEEIGGPVFTHSLVLTQLRWVLDVFVE